MGKVETWPKALCEQERDIMSEDAISKAQREAGYEATRQELAENPLESRSDYTARMVVSGLSELTSFGTQKDFNLGVQAALNEALEDLED